MDIENQYSSSLVKEIFDTCVVVRETNVDTITSLVKSWTQLPTLLSGEGSSRIFPAKNICYRLKKSGIFDAIYTEGSYQSLEYPMDNHNVFISSNSGKTKESIVLLRKIKENTNCRIIGVTSYEDSPLAKESESCYILNSGFEEAIAASKSVIAQALFYEIFFRSLYNLNSLNLTLLSHDIEVTLKKTIEPKIIDSLCKANHIYFCGRNNGVAEELALKTNEITRKPSSYLEGTILLHGIEEIMQKNEAIVLIDPYLSEEKMIQEKIKNKIGVFVCSISNRNTLFPTFHYGSSSKDHRTYLELVSGWSILVDVGLRLGVDIDKPQRARKIGNEIF